MRAISAVLDLSWVYGELSARYPALGRPSIDPVLMIRMLILGYAFANAITSLTDDLHTAFTIGLKPMRADQRTDAGRFCLDGVARTKACNFHEFRSSVLVE